MKDDAADAIPELETAEKLDPSASEPPYVLGVLYMQAGRYADKPGALNTTLKLRPEKRRWLGDAGQRRQSPRAPAGSRSRPEGNHPPASPATGSASDAGCYAGKGEPARRNYRGVQDRRRPDEREYELPAVESPATLTALC